MKTKSPKTLLAAAAALVVAGLLTVTHAQTNIWTNPITGTNPNLSNPYTTGDVADSNITVSGIGRGSGITGSNANNRYNASSFNTASIDLDAYFTFTLTPDSGYEIDFNSFNVTFQNSATGPLNLAFRSSVDGFASNIWTTNWSGAATTAHTISLSGASYQDITNAIEFRLYGWGASAGTGTGSVNDFIFNGNVNPTGGGGNELYWTANGSSLGGAGTWNTSGSNWSSDEVTVVGALWDSTKQAIFTNSAATVTVSSVSVEKGIKFATTGYTLDQGTITLAGAALVDNAIETDAGVSATITSVLAGTTGLSKTGSGTLVLSGTNTYTGGTVVSDGDLIGTTTSLQGNITNNAAVTFDQSTTGTYSSAMSGTGSLTKAGSGDVTLSGANTYSGGTLVSAGSLIGTTTSLQGAITNNAAVTFDQTADGSYAGALSGTGSLTKSGSGSVTLSGANSYSGGTLVTAGRLIGTTTSLQGAITNNAAVTFDQTTNGTYAGDLTGTGSLTKSGSGAVTLSGANTYSDGTLVSAGTLIGTTTSLQGNITNNATVTFDQSSAGSYGGEMSGTGELVKEGTGAVTLGSDNTHAGGTTVNKGSLIVASDAALGSGDVQINEGDVVASVNSTIANNFVIGTAGGSPSTNSFTISWNFGTSSGNDNPSSSDADGFTISSVSHGNNNGTTTLLNSSSASSGYTGASGQYNAGAAAYTGALDTSTNTYFEFTLTRTDATSVTLEDVSFGSRSTSTGPQHYGIYETGDLSTALADDTMVNTGTWVLENAAFTDTTVSTNGTTFRIYGYDGTGSATPGTANWRIDDLTLTGHSVNGAVASGSGTIGVNDAVTATYTGDITANHNATLTAASGGQAIFNGVIGGDGTIAKAGAGTVTFSGSSANTQTGKITVSAGVLELNKTSATAIAGSLEVQSSATLLLSASGQVADASAVTLSGGTIQRASGVNEVFGNLNLTTDSAINYGTGATGTLTFGTYTPSSLLSVASFLEGNKLVFGSDLTTSVTNSSYFSFDNGFTSSWDGSTFTITAIPEPAAYVAAAGLIGLMLWPSRRRLIKDAKSILGLRPPARDRLTKRA